METEKERKLDETPTWAVTVVCFVMLAISIFIEHIIHFIGHWLKKRNKPALYEALKKVKGELMLMGFISFVLTLLQDHISSICISKKVASTWRPCDAKSDSGDSAKSRNLLGFSDSITRRFLASNADNCKEGDVPFVSAYGIHQIHVFIFVLAIFHILQCIITLTLGRTKMRIWRKWEDETKTVEYQFSHDPERFRFTKDTSFGRRHLNIWSKSSVSLWIACFFRQFFGSVTKVDYMTLRHGFITTHLAPGSEEAYDFQSYIKRTVDEDFKVVVGISPIIWFSAVLFLLTNTDGWYSYLWLPFIPLIIILLVGAKLQVIITNMGVGIHDRGDIVKGTPVVELGDHLFWFNSPRFLLNLIHFVLFQNALQLAFFTWSSYAFGSIHSCFHRETANVVIRLTTGILIQVLCSYVTLPLYALVTQMGSTMKPTIFNERVATALKGWYHSARKDIKGSKYSEANTPLTSAPGTPTRGMSPVHLLYKHPGHGDSAPTSPRALNYENHAWDLEEGPSSPTTEGHEIQMMQVGGPGPVGAQYESGVSNREFSFGKNPQDGRRLS